MSSKIIGVIGRYDSHIRKLRSVPPFPSIATILPLRSLANSFDISCSSLLSTLIVVKEISGSNILNQQGKMEMDQGSASLGPKS